MQEYRIACPVKERAIAELGLDELVPGPLPLGDVQDRADNPVLLCQCCRRKDLDDPPALLPHGKLHIRDCGVHPDLPVELFHLLIIKQERGKAPGSKVLTAVPEDSRRQHTDFADLLGPGIECQDPCLRGFEDLP